MDPKVRPPYPYPLPPSPSPWRRALSLVAVPSLHRANPNRQPASKNDDGQVPPPELMAAILSQRDSSSVSSSQDTPPSRTPYDRALSTANTDVSMLNHYPSSESSSLSISASSHIGSEPPAAVDNVSAIRPDSPHSTIRETQSQGQANQSEASMQSSITPEIDAILRPQAHRLESLPPFVPLPASPRPVSETSQVPLSPPAAPNFFTPEQQQPPTTDPTKGGVQMPSSAFVHPQVIFVPAPPIFPPPHLPMPPRILPINGALVVDSVGMPEEDDQHIVWDAVHNDPKGNLIIAVGNHRWRMSSYHLEKDSGLIRHLLDSHLRHCSITLKVPTSSSLAVDVYLAAINTHDEEFVRHILRPEHLEDFCRLCDFLQSPHLEHKVVRHLTANGTEHAWGTFLLAAKRNHVVMAKAALRSMDRAAWCPARNLHLMTTADIAEMPSVYLLELFRQRLCPVYRGGEKRYTEVPWEKVAERFDPGRGD